MPTDTSEKNTSKAASQAGKYLTFVLGQESYGIPVLVVREIIKLPAITTVPQMPPDIRGVVNLRGKIIPVVDLRLRFGLSYDDKNENSCIIVVQVKTSRDTSRSMGLVVDAVEEVSQIAAGEIEETPDFGVAVDTRYILGMAKIKGIVKALLDINKIVSTDTIEAAMKF